MIFSVFRYVYVMSVECFQCAVCSRKFVVIREFTSDFYNENLFVWGCYFFGYIFFRFKTSLSCQMSKVIKLWCAVSCFSPKKNLILKISFLGCMFRDLLLDVNSSFNYLKNKWFYHYNSYTMYFCTQGYYSFGRKILKFFQNLSDTFEEYCIVCRVFVVFFMTSFGLH